MIDPECRRVILPALADSDFSGSLECRRDKLEISEVGQIVADNRVFQIYDYRYSLEPICSECAVHGGQRVIIIADGRYVGQYKPYDADVSVEGNTLVLSTSVGKQSRAVVHFESDGPPSRIRFDGELLNLFR